MGIHLYDSDGGHTYLTTDDGWKLYIHHRLDDSIGYEVTCPHGATHQFNKRKTPQPPQPEVILTGEP